jgi:hypothetical protein
VEADGQFATIGVPHGRHVLRVSGIPDGWFLESARAGERDLAAGPFDLDGDLAGVRLVFTDRPTGITGDVSSGGVPDDRAIVVVFPDDRTAWVDYGRSPRRLRSGRTTAAGGFRVMDLPPGAYLVAALREATAADWAAPESLDALARIATRVELAAGDTRRLALQTVR